MNNEESKKDKNKIIEYHSHIFLLFEILGPDPNFNQSEADKLRINSDLNVIDRDQNSSILSLSDQAAGQETTLDITKISMKMGW